MEYYKKVKCISKNYTNLGLIEEYFNRIAYFCEQMLESNNNVFVQVYIYNLGHVLLAGRTQHKP